MPDTPDSSNAETFVLAGRIENGSWQKIESATREEGETEEDVRAFLETMAQANTRSFLDLEIMTEAEFLRRCPPTPEIAA